MRSSRYTVSSLPPSFSIMITLSLEDGKSPCHLCISKWHLKGRLREASSQGGHLARLASKGLINNPEILNLMAALLCASCLLPWKAHEFLGLADGVRRAESAQGGGWGLTNTQCWFQNNGCGLSHLHFSPTEDGGKELSGQAVQWLSGKQSFQWRLK